MVCSLRPHPRPKRREPQRPLPGSPQTGLGARRPLGSRVGDSGPDLEPSSPGVHSAFWLGQYDRLIDSLPKGTHAIVDFVDTPSWVSGSSAANAPPSNPADYANILHFIAAALPGTGPRMRIWNEEDAPIWWTGAPDPASYTRLLQAFSFRRYQVGRPCGQGGARRVDRQ